MKDRVEEIIDQVVANKSTLIQLLKDKIQEFQNLTWESVPTSYLLRRGHYVWNGAAVRWKRRHNYEKWYPDGYGEIMENPHKIMSLTFEYDEYLRIDPVDLEHFPPLELASFAEYVLKELKEAIKEELLKKEGR